MKLCTRCAIEKNLDCFGRNKARKDGLDYYCRPCRSAQVGSKRRQTTEYHQAYYAANREKLKADAVERARKDRLVNPIRVIKDRLRTRLNKAIRRGYKSGSAVSDLGCSIVEFMSYIETKFQAGMTWDNWSRSGWHLDHIVPLSSFDLSDPEQFKRAVHYTNLQPLWARDNLIKSSKVSAS